MTTRAKKTEDQDLPVVGIYMKLWKAKNQMGKVMKNSTNPHFKKSYADLNALLEVIEPVLLENGLLLLQPIQENKVVTQIIDIDSGDRIESFIDLPVSNNAQQLGSAVTYFRRYSLQSIMSMQAVDDDGNEAAKSKPAMPADRFQKGIDKVAAGEMTVDAFKKAVSSYELTEVQQKSILLL